MNITVFRSFFKARRSTKRPGDGTVVECTLRLPTSIRNPAFQLTVQYENVTYIQWEDRYYYVTDVTYIHNGIIEVSCALDVLATARNTIIGSSQYVSRSQAVYNYAIPDSMNPPTDSLKHQTTITGMPVNFDSTRTGCCILGIGVSSVGASGVPNRGTAVYYALTGAELVQLSQAMSAGSVLEELSKQFNGGMNGIITAMYLNIPVSAVPGSGSGSIIIGDWNSGVNAKVVNNRLISGGATVPFNTYYGDPDCYLNKEPYTSVYMYLPYVGVIPIDTMIHQSNVKVDAYLDVFTGALSYRLSSTATDADSIPISIYKGKAGIDIPISMESRNILGAMSGAVTTFRAANQHDIFGATGGVLGVAGALSLNTQVLGSVGDIGNVSLGDQFIYTHTLTRVPAHSITNPLARIGAPLEEYRALSGLSGYVQCRDAHLDWSGIDIRNEVETMMNNGIYIE